MAARWSAVARRASRRMFSTGGKVLSEEEKAAENVYIKKMEQEKLEKLARKGPKPGDEASATSGSVDAKTGSTASSSGVSSDKNRNYAVLAGTVAAVSALGWYMLSKPGKQKDTTD